MSQSKLPPRLSAKESLILEALAARSPMYGLEFVASSNGKLKRGTIYVTLARMEDKGYVESETEPRRPGAVGLPRRLYRPTAFGLRVLAAWGAVCSTLAWEPADGRRSP
ncbi:MAG: PadR family transcriptional regulator [Acidobacteriota bacterium]